MLFQCIKDCRSISVFISGIKGQINDFLVCITGIVGIVLFKIIDGGVSGRTFPLPPESLIPSPWTEQQKKFLGNGEFAR